MTPQVAKNSYKREKRANRKVKHAEDRDSETDQNKDDNKQNLDNFEKIELPNGNDISTCGVIDERKLSIKQINKNHNILDDGIIYESSATSGKVREIFKVTETFWLLFYAPTWEIFCVSQ